MKMLKQTQNGNCFMCGKTATKTAMKNHICKDHNSGDESCFLIKAEGAYNNDYWLFFSVALDATLTTVDKFLRQIWCECCGHLSAFRQGGREFGKARKVSALDVGDKLLYEYDFGTTTEILLTVVDKISRPKQREKVLLLARNEPIVEPCETCQAPAVCVDAWEGVAYCEKCAEEADENALLPVVNSPRMGECGYDGEEDRWIFDPKKFG
jgi:hypothetical protein